MVKIVNEQEDNKRLNLEGAKVKYIVKAGAGQYGKTNVVIIFEKGSDAYIWVTNTSTKAFADFKEGDTCDIQAYRWDPKGRYISNVKRIK